ncbi:MAG: inorganic phosphate transporter [Desulfobacterales bacterium]|jgi:PiT family inorganic phosphate transporter
MLSLLGAIFLGWSLGANDASNAFGSAVSSRMVKFWTAAILASLFVVLGANNVANVTAVFVGAGKLTVFSASVVGGLSIALGILTFSREVMETVGKKLVRLDPFSALVVVLAEGLTVHFYTFVGVPVSTSQAVIGAVLGVGVVKGINTVSRRTLINILIGWLLTPAIAGFIAVALYFVVNLHFIPER